VFFPTARYRLPALILLLPFAAAMLIALFDRVRQGISEGGRSATPIGAGSIVACLLLGLANPVASNVFRHPVKDRAEHLFFGASWELRKIGTDQGSPLEADMLAQADEAMRIDPEYPEPPQLLAVYYVLRDIDRSLAYFSRLEELVPNDNDVLDQIRAAQAIRDRKQP
jgi:hypothetical protein